MGKWKNITERKDWNNEGKIEREREEAGREVRGRGEGDERRGREARDG